MNTPSQPSSWLGNFLTLLFGPKMLVMLLTGFSSGLPLLLTGSTLKFWMREEGLDLTTIGFFGLVGLPYTLKFLWAPLMDRIVPPFGGRRRGWMLITQVSLMITLGFMAFAQPSIHLPAIVGLCLLIAFASASQDIVLDAYRREYLKDEELGIGSSVFVNGYRIGLLASGAMALVLAEYLSWPAAYFILGMFMLVGIVATVYAPEPVVETAPPTSLREAFVGTLSRILSAAGMAVDFAVHFAVQNRGQYGFRNALAFLGGPGGVQTSNRRHRQNLWVCRLNYRRHACGLGGLSLGYYSFSPYFWSPSNDFHRRICGIGHCRQPSPDINGCDCV